jgi:hypothetical protein
MLRRTTLAAVLVALVALVLVGGLAVFASAQPVQVKQFACYGGGPSTLRNFYYLPNGADPCPYGWTKIDWIDD